MGAENTIDWRYAAASALDWWHEAGVDTLVDDVPRDWFAAPEPLVIPTASPVSAPVASPVAPYVVPTAMPALLAEFLEWRRGAQVPEADWSGVSLAAIGPADATVMVLVDCPDRDDGADNGGAGALLSGASGRLLDRMLAAIGLTRDEVHLAAVCAKRPTAGRIQREVEDRLAEIAKHHIGLIGPERLLLLGNAASRAILGMELQAARGRLHAFNHKTAQAGAEVVSGADRSGPDITGVVASFHPRFLIEKPAAKAEAWKDLQMLMREPTSQGPMSQGTAR